MNPRRLYARIVRGEVQNVDFADFVRLLSAFGFEPDGTRGSHRFFRHHTGTRLSLQPRGGQAKDYQIHQFLELVEAEGLDWEEANGS